jgi:hypothetical protein
MNILSLVGRGCEVQFFQGSRVGKEERGGTIERIKTNSCRIEIPPPVPVTQPR